MKHYLNAVSQVPLEVTLHLHEQGNEVEEVHLSLVVEAYQGEGGGMVDCVCLTCDGVEVGDHMEAVIFHQSFLVEACVVEENGHYQREASVVEVNEHPEGVSFLEVAMDHGAYPKEMTVGLCHHEIQLRNLHPCIKKT